MARLLKKKSPSNKKKSKQDNDKTEIPQESKNGLIKAILKPDSPTEVKKVQVLQQKKPLPGIKSVTEKESNNYYQRALQFLREVKIELKKVTWPSRKQTVGSTVVVIILVMIISLFLGVVDIGLSSLVRVVLQ